MKRTEKKNRKQRATEASKTATTKTATKSKVIAGRGFVKNEDRPLCQNCTSHSNKPSYCALQEEFVMRKGTCDNFTKAA